MSEGGGDGRDDGHDDGRTAAQAPSTALIHHGYVPPAGFGAIPPANMPPSMTSSAPVM